MPPKIKTAPETVVVKPTVAAKKSQARAKSTRAKPAADATLPVTIVGIGASAGGLEALEQFLSPVPPDCGLAFVIVQHLDPTYKGAMVELLQRSTRMPVAEIKDRTKVKANHVYLIPPNCDLSVLHGVLHLLEPAAPRGLRLPIDSFLRALAADSQAQSIGVILSGMGSDGTLGLRAIKEKAGMVFVQTPATAKFDGMPCSAIDAGLADVVAPADQLFGNILAYLHNEPLLNSQFNRKGADINQSGLEKVLLLLRTQIGHDFSFYKKSTIYRRIERRMSLHQLTKIADYVRYLRSNPQEAELLFKELLIGVTNFFRDPNMWQKIMSDAMPALLAARPLGAALRAWSAGCSTGEEAYSLAMVFRETIEEIKPIQHFTLQIFATDLDPDAIEKARTGTYPLTIASDIPEARLRRFFIQEELSWRVTKELREMVIFAPQNLVMDPPFTKLDVIFCRNLLIYLEPELQKKLMLLFHYSLNPGGILVLGSSETVGQTTDLFTELPGKQRIYQRKEVGINMLPIEFPTSFMRNNTHPGVVTSAIRSSVSLHSLFDALVLQRFAPGAVLTTDKGDIIYFSGKTGRYLEPASGKANLNVLAMARQGLDVALNASFGRAIRLVSEIKTENVKVGTNGGTVYLDVTVQPLLEPAMLHGMVLIVFNEVAPPAPPGKPLSKTERATAQGARVINLMEQLQRAREELQTKGEEMQTSQEELKSINEELQSTNEEIQSTNEELTTSREEMQSMNEELQTVNHELQAKVSELTESGDDMKNLLDSTNIATLFLDDDLKVRRFTSRVTQIIKLIPGDAGRPITDLSCSIDYPQLVQDAIEVQRTLIFHERQMQANDGRWYAVRVMPYRKQDKRIDGVVITFIDISATKRLEIDSSMALAVQLATHKLLESSLTERTAEVAQYKLAAKVSKVSKVSSKVAR
jgi:two-component system CheB/CheR fusion protein